MAERRSPGEGGAARLRPDGRWEATVELPPSPGRKRRRKSVYGATKTEVLQKQRRLKADLAAGKVAAAAPPARLTLAAYLSDWLAREKAQGRRVRTVEFYAWAVEHHLAPALGTIPLAKLTRGDVQGFLDAKAQTLSPTTVGHLHHTLRAALNDAIRRELVDRNAATLVTTPRQQKHRARVLTVEEAGRLLAAAKGHRLEAMVSVAIALGLRPGEYFGLCWDAVDLEPRTLRVRTGLERADGAWRLAELKTEGSLRPLILPQATATALREHRVRQGVERALAGERYEDMGLVFCTRLGRPLGEPNVNRTFKRWLAAAALPREIRPYDLRHSCASLLLAQHVPARMIQELLGHASITTTLNVYAHVLPSLAAETADKMDALLGAMLVKELVSADLEEAAGTD